MRILITLIVAAVVTLTGCGGGNGGVRPDVVQQPPQTVPVPVPELETSTLTTGGQTQENTWSYDPVIALPDDGTDGIRVQRPSNIGAAGFSIYYSPRAESILNAYGAKFAELTKDLIERSIAIGYKQWSRHIPGLRINTAFGVVSGVCDTAAACATDSRHGTGILVIPERHLQELAYAFAYGLVYEDTAVLRGWEAWVTHLATHEVGHNVGYMRKPGEACLNNQGRRDCHHAPNSTKSVMSYAQVGRVHVTREDIERVPGGVWNPTTRDEYMVWKPVATDSIESYGFWLRHDFDVEGTYGAWPNILGASTATLDQVHIVPFVNGTPSTSHGITSGTVTWSGTDNFIGYSRLPTSMEMLRADAALEYTFAQDGGSMRVDVDAFEYFIPGSATWSADINDPSFWYRLSCDADGCSGDDLPFEGSDETFDLKVSFYPEGDDDSAWTGGVLNDRANEYAGAFAAEKD